MKKILYIVSGINSFGGIESFCKTVVPLIDFEKYQVDFLVTQNEPLGDGDKLFESLGSKIYRIDSHGGIMQRIKGKSEFFKNLPCEYDIVHIHTVLTTAFYFARLVKKYTKAKVIMHSHTASNYEGATLKNNLCRRLLNKYSDYKIACSADAARFLFGENNCGDSQIIYNPVKIEEFKFDENLRMEKRKELNLSDNCFAVLIVGRLTPAKNHTFLLDVFKEVGNKIPNSKLILCGGGELKEDIERKINALELSDRVLLLGNRSDVGEIMSACDCFVLPSLYEGLGTVLVEAQTSGLPIVYSDRIPKEVMIDKSAYRLSLEKINDWVEAIANIAQSNAKERKLECLDEIIEKFSDKSIANHINDFYDRIDNNEL